MIGEGCIMGVVLKEILKLDYCSHFKLIAGKKGLEKEIRTVGILEDERVEELNRVFFSGDFVLTTFYHIKDEPEEIIKVIKAFVKLNIVGIAIKEKYFQVLPDAVLAYADKEGFPIFTYGKDINTEQIIFALLKALKDEEDDTYMASKVHGILSGNMSKQIIRKIALEINSSFRQNVLVSYFQRTDDNKTAVSMINSGPYRDKFSTAISYKEGILIITSFEDTPVEINRFYEQNGIDYKQNAIGVSGKAYKLDQLDTAIKEALYAFKVSEMDTKGLLSYNHLGIYQMILPVIENDTVRAFKNSIIDPLMHYDTRYNSALLETIKAFVLNHGDYKNTAEALFQHKNTVRYRVNKGKELLDLDESYGSFYEQVSLAIRIKIIEDGM